MKSIRVYENGDIEFSPWYRRHELRKTGKVKDAVFELLLSLVKC